MKKKIISALLSMALVGTLLMGCGAKEEPKAEETKTEAEAPKEEAPADAPAETVEPRVLTFASQSVGSGTYTRVAAYCEIINKYLPEGWSVEISPVSSGAKASVLLVEQGECDLGSGVNITNKLMVDGLDADVDGLERVGVVWAGTDISYSTIVFSKEFHEKTGFDTLEELIESGTPFRLATKAEGSSGIQAARDILSCMDSSFEDIEANGGETFHIDPTQMCDMLKEGTADVIIDCPSLGQAALTELSLTTELYFPALSDKTLEGMAKLGYPTTFMPAGSWTGQTNDMYTASNCDSIVAGLDIPEDVVYAIAKAICEDLEELVELSPTAASFDPEHACDPLYAGAPLHPGAEKYYKEVGYLK